MDGSNATNNSIFEKVAADNGVMAVRRSTPVTADTVGSGDAIRCTGGAQLANMIASVVNKQRCSG